MGHQDDKVSKEDIDRWGQLNIEMDTLAKQHINYAKSRPRHYPLSVEPWSLWMNEIKIIKNFDETLYDIVHGHGAKEYWISKERTFQRRTSTRSTGILLNVRWKKLAVLVGLLLPNMQQG
jgi:hypothetical protein